MTFYFFVVHRFRYFSKLFVDERINVINTMAASVTEHRALERADNSEYYRALVRPDTAQLQKLDHLPILRFGGQDSNGHTVVVLTPVYLFHRVTESMNDLRILFNYLVYRLDHIADRPFTVVYCHTNMRIDELDLFRFAKQYMNALPSKYMRNIKNLHIVHHNWFFRMSIWWEMKFKRKAYAKVRFVNKLTDLDHSVISQPGFWNVFPHLVQDEDNYLCSLPPMRVFGAPLDALCERTGVDVAPFQSIPETLHLLVSEIALHAKSDIILSKFPPAEAVYGLVHTLDRGGPYHNFEDASELWVRIIYKEFLSTKFISNTRHDCFS